MLSSLTDTICAPATAKGRAGIAVIRVSGPYAFGCVDRILQQPRSCADHRGYSLHRATVVDESETVDDVLVSVFRSPKSFTGEDVVEISCHGGSVPIARTISLLLRAGCRLAGPGEFTQRAFLNGKIDLAQAEAVCDMINAQSDAAYRQALRQSSGALSQKIESIRSILLQLLARIEASIDFPEDVGELDVRTCLPDLDIAELQIKSLLAAADRGILLRTGAQVVIAGRPNAGKSSLMNALLRHDRAIVTPIAGTTRDTLEETIDIQGIAVRLWDTAGLHPTDDPIESIGVERSKSALAQADLVMLVIDSSEGLHPEDRLVLDAVDQNRLLTVWNKSDLKPAGDVQVSALTGEGIEELEALIAQHLTGNSAALEEETPTASHHHQKLALEQALELLRHATLSASISLPADFLSIDIQGALSKLGEITGLTTNEDVISQIFSTFCIGK